MKVVASCCLFLGFGSWPANAAPPLQVNGERIIQHLKALSEFGRNPEGGVSRVAYTPADLAGRQYVMGLMRDAGLDVSVDVAGNLVGTRAGTDKADCWGALPSPET
jgi:N-carbamoyl-L-amino-acid hydrolase